MLDRNSSNYIQANNFINQEPRQSSFWPKKKIKSTFRDSFPMSVKLIISLPLANEKLLITTAKEIKVQKAISSASFELEKRGKREARFAERTEAPKKIAG